MHHFNHGRTHQGKRYQERTPIVTFLNWLELIREKNLVEKMAAYPLLVIQEF